MTEAVKDCNVGSGVTLDTVANAGRERRIILYCELEASYSVPEDAAFTCGSRVVPNHIRGIEVPRDDEVVLLRLCECGLRDEKRCGALLRGLYTLSTCRRCERS